LVLVLKQGFERFRQQEDVILVHLSLYISL
jgi:hypothetical protein